jgi:uncharacterized protein (TIGR02757 family)
VTPSKNYLDKLVLKYNTLEFISNDPICIPHLFTKTQDIEIMGFFAAIFAWGNRTTIINKCKELIWRMDNSPHDFVLNHSDEDLKRLLGFKHRTFNDTDLLYTISFFKHWYTHNPSLEIAFSQFIRKGDATVENGLNGFRETFFNQKDAPTRTKKQVASPLQNSACKRINMYLRWMVRTDQNGVDFGLWKQIKPAQLVCPLDVHVQRVAIQLGLLHREQSDWRAAIELTETLKKFDPKDPVKYDFALFGLGVNQDF